MDKIDEKPRRGAKTSVWMTDALRQEICLRVQAGESRAALAAQYGVTVRAIARWCVKWSLRLCDLPPALRPSGRVRVTMGAGGAAMVVCAELSFRFDRNDPEATLDTIYDRIEVAALRGWEAVVTKLTRMASALMQLAERHERLRARKAKRPPSPEASEGSPPEVEKEAALTLRPAQTPPAKCADGSDWRTWLFLGGRGAGKTLAGASWLADQAQRLGEGGRLALIGPTLHDVREVMIEGASGVRNLPRWTDETRPVFEPSRRRVRFYGGCQAYVFSAEEPDRLRGPQFAGAWADEFCAWPKGEETLALLRMGLRLPGAPSAVANARLAEPRCLSAEGDGAQAASDRVASDSLPRLVVTTTPRPTRALIGLRDEASCVQTHAGTAENEAHLAAGFVEGLRALYGGTRREAQELEGRVVDLDGALFTAEMMAAARCAEWRVAGGEWLGDGGNAEGGAKNQQASEAGAVPSSPATSHPPLDRIVVAIDPTATLGGDACGIVAVGVRRRADGRREAVVLADRSARGLSPDGWARRALALAAEVGAGAIVAEVNQGGDMVAQVLKAAGCSLRVREVRATRGKRIRAEPVAALYEQGRVKHAQAFGPLEEELMALGAESEPAGSLDRADALVWAITDLLIDGPEGDFGPRMRWV